ncbi:hypothetical protein [Sphingomonas hengshuiensis]|uniref:hypothetical protein n=1 Tax=Sphingomonas hengshuiensis TaxID=1609977 RepID=UPI000B233E02|nr:hypothetical protein [Sphingomonas hengshuiensis]
MNASFWVMLAGMLYCGIASWREFRRGSRWFALAGAAVTLAMLMVPIETHAVKIDLPMR